MAGSDAADFVVWPENANAVQVFVASSTQWRYRPAAKGAQVVGLDYPSVEAVMRIYGMRGRDTFDKVRAMEMAALEVFRGIHG